MLDRGLNWHEHGRSVSIKELGHRSALSRNDPNRIAFVGAAEARARAGGSKLDPFKDEIPAALDGR